MRAGYILIMAVALVVGCEKRSERVAFDGQFYNSKAKKVDGDLSQFQVSVSPVSQSLTGAKEAGRYEATKYCIKNYGTSDIIWAVGPDAEDTALPIEKNSLYLRGQCDG